MEDTSPGRPKSVHGSGAENRRLYVDAVDEALQKKVRDGKKHGLPRQPRRRLIDVSIKQLRLVEKQQRLLGKALTLAGDALDASTAMEMVHASKEITDQISRLSEGIREGVAAERQAMKGLSNDDFDDVLRLHLTRVAADMNADDKRVVLTTWFGEEIARVMLAERDGNGERL